MSDEPLEPINLAEQLLILNQQIANLRASVNVLKVFAAGRLIPGDPVEGLKVLRQLEEKQIDRDPHEQTRKETFELLDAVKQWKKTGRQSGES